MAQSLSDYLNCKRPTLGRRFKYCQSQARSRLPLKPSPSTSTDFGMHLDGKPIHFSEWRKRTEFCREYQSEQTDCVVHRSTRFENGDILLCNRNRGSDGIFTTLVEGEQQFSHVAIFVELEFEGKLYPSVVEIQLQGVRAVPLNVFLSSGFSTYVEVFRCNSIKDQHKKSLAQEALSMLEEQHGFDIFIDESQTHYLTCARVIEQLYLRAGLRPIAGRSRYSLKTLPNLRVLGVEGSAHRDLLMPDDYSKSEDFSIVGVIDNGQFVQVVARALMRLKIQEIWQTQTLSKNSFPFEVRLLQFAISCIQKNIFLLSLLFRNFFGFTKRNFPSGPACFISLTPQAERYMERATLRLESELRRNWRELLMANSVLELAKIPTIAAIAEDSISGFSRLFVSRTIQLPNIKAKRKPVFRHSID